MMRRCWQRSTANIRSWGDVIFRNKSRFAEPGFAMWKRNSRLMSTMQRHKLCHENSNYGSSKNTGGEKLALDVLGGEQRAGYYGTGSENFVKEVLVEVPLNEVRVPMKDTVIDAENSDIYVMPSDYDAEDMRERRTERVNPAGRKRLDEGEGSKRKRRVPLKVVELIQRSKDRVYIHSWRRAPGRRRNGSRGLLRRSRPEDACIRPAAHEPRHLASG